MARKSELQKSIRETIIESERPEPPAHLTPDQAAEWKRIFLLIEPSWIPPESYRLLIDLCRHIVEGNHLANMIEAYRANTDDVLSTEYIKGYDKLLKMQKEQSRLVSSHMTRLRLTSQSLRSDKSERPTATDDPWEFQ